MADSSCTVTRPSRTVTALLNGLVNMLFEKLSGKREEGSGKAEEGWAMRDAGCGMRRRLARERASRVPHPASRYTLHLESLLGNDSHSLFAASAPGRPR